MTATIKFYLFAALMLLVLSAAVRIKDVRASLDLGSRTGLTSVLHQAALAAGGGR